MDCEPEELQHLNLFGVYRESSKLILSWRRLFSQISACLIIPLSLLFLAHIQISHLLFAQISRSETALERTPAGSPSESRLLDRLSSEWLSFLLFKSAYLLSLLLLSLLSTAAVVYTVASAHTSKHHVLLSYAKVLSVVPRVWRRLARTFLFAFLVLVAYNLLAIVAIVGTLILFGDSALGIILALSLVVLYVGGIVWISVVWHVASVVSVLEDACGAEAMRRSRGLVRGRMLLAVSVFVKMNLAFVGIEVLFRWLVVGGAAGPVAARIGVGMVMLALMSIVVLFALVAQTVVYFVCKSFHHQSIDKSALADHLEVYLGEYVPLKEKDVQMEQLQV